MRAIVGDSIVRKTDSALKNGHDICFPGTQIEAITERVENHASGQGRIYFSTRMD